MKKQFESGFYQKLNTFADWVLRITVINIMIILTSLPVVTIYPALLAGYKLYHKYLNKEEVPMIKSYFKFFTENFGKKMQIGLVLAFALILGFVNVTIYQDFLQTNPNPFNVIGQYVMIIMVLSVVFVSMFTLPLMITYPNTDTWLLIKFAFFLSGKYVIKTVLAVLIMLIPFLMLLHPITIFIFLFAGLSTPVCLYALLFKKVVTFVEGLDKENV
ncbi:Predicted integral membrane protein [Acholeplasma oculi]|uniref:DUF624 domain-containing protein n=1 Tax=Acholeplasma oculi TaxID=35623 RepID=A0A061ABL2_9MOLU|nr:DUF624 domain-containing protein [Acholeplasma oculi]CDR31255.1 hypothetical protein, DUF624 [Acholeplasma oculi]SKC38455.1 Uncharacterized membrane protein YesL [Acholeplasma oculi]SUT91367.1 Predicted integral membrane protein [Acholeplasma oculi]